MARSTVAAPRRVALDVEGRGRGAAMVEEAEHLQLGEEMAHGAVEVGGGGLA
jgi:hypothetical protein